MTRSISIKVNEPPVYFKKSTYYETVNAGGTLTKNFDSEINCFEPTIKILTFNKIGGNYTIITGQVSSSVTVTCTKYQAIGDYNI